MFGTLVLGLQSYMAEVLEENAHFIVPFYSLCNLDRFRFMVVYDDFRLAVF